MKFREGNPVYRPEPFDAILEPHTGNSYLPWAMKAF